MQARYLFAALALAACSPDATAPTVAVSHPAMTVYADLPAPVVSSAQVVGTQDGLPIVRVSFTDVADDEALINVYFTNADGSHSTQSIGAQPGTGDHTVDVYALPGVAFVQLNYRWDDASFGTACGCVYGPLSNAVAVTGDVGATLKRKGKK